MAVVAYVKCSKNVKLSYSENMKNHEDSLLCKLAHEAIFRKTIDFPLS